MKKDSQESITKQIVHYTAKHKHFDGELSFEQRKRTPNQLRVRQLKKLKLLCKDKLVKLRAALVRKQKPSAEVIPLPVHQSTAAPAVQSPLRVASG
jgi:hypothetical protein